jgi:transcriptional regulator with XRE-family HTH domain
MSDTQGAPDAPSHDQAFGRRFSRWRKTTGFSVAELADAAGLSATTIYSWEEGKTSPTREAWEMVRDSLVDYEVPEPTEDEFSSSRLGRRVRRDTVPPPPSRRKIDPPQNLADLRQALEDEFPGKRVTPHHLADFVVVFGDGESSSIDLRQLEEDLDVSARWCVHDARLAVLVDRRVKGELSELVLRHLGVASSELRVVAHGQRVDVCLGQLNPETGTCDGVFVNVSELVTTLNEIWQAQQDRRVLVHVSQIRIAQP